MRLPRHPLPFSPVRRAAVGARRGTVRRAFTLLEIILALGIGALLLAGLYYALNVQVGHTHSGRKIVERSALARGILNKIQADILASLGPQDPNFSQPGGASASASSTASSGTTASSTMTSGSTTTGSTSSSGSGTSSSGTSGSGAPTNPMTFNMGMQGTSTQLSIYASRLPREAIKQIGSNSAASSASNGNSTQSTMTPSDLRLVTYWLASSGSGGLARQEVKAVTSSDAANNLPPNVADETQYIIHPEVVSLQFQYFDGTTWQDSWDGTQPGSDGQTPQGPPAAVAITLSITQPTGRAQGGQAANAAAPTYQFRHVVTIPTANSYAASTNSSTTPGSSNAGGTTSSGN
jgi:prepilin-type N-terminal cleavage/methylation domain-containing protein